MSKRKKHEKMVVLTKDIDPTMEVGTWEVQFSPDAVNEWEGWSSANKKTEVGALLVGSVEQGVVFVDEILPVKQKVSGGDFDLDDDAHADAVAMLVAQNRGVKVVGWIHKHPGNSTPTPSSTDWQTQGKLSIGTDEPRVMAITGQMGLFSTIHVTTTIRMGEKIYVIPNLTTKGQPFYPPEWDDLVEESISFYAESSRYGIPSGNHWWRAEKTRHSREWKTTDGKKWIFDFDLQCFDNSDKGKEAFKAMTDFLVGLMTPGLPEKPYLTLAKIYKNSRKFCDHQNWIKLRRHMWEMIAGAELKDDYSHKDAAKGSIFEDTEELIATLHGKEKVEEALLQHGSYANEREYREAFDGFWETINIGAMKVLGIEETQ